MKRTCIGTKKANHGFALPLSRRVPPLTGQRKSHKKNYLIEMKKLNRIPTLALAGILGLAAASTSQALTFTATGTGPITAYFYDQSAGYGSDIGLWVNGVAQGIYGLQNHSSAQGQSLVLGTANAGDTLVFELRVSTSDAAGPPPVDYSLYSDAGLNPLGEEHTTASAYSLGEFGIPNGTLVGFEDIFPIADSDGDYDDHQFVFTGVRSHDTPEGGSTLAIMGLATVAIGALRRRMK